MIAALSYLVSRSARNRLIRQARRLRSFRYVAALLVGVAYLGFVFWDQEAPAQGGAEYWAVIELVAALGLSLVMAWAWVVGTGPTPLAFSPAEVTLLFPAPLTRHQLVHFKLLRAQSLVLLNAVLWALLLSPDRLSWAAAFRGLSIWVLLSTLQLHRVGAALARANLLQHGRRGFRRRLVTVGVLGVVVIAIAWSLIASFPALAGAWQEDVSTFIRALRAALEAPVPAALLMPFRLLVRPLGAESAAAWLAAIWPAVLILAAHYVWVLRSDAVFEEAAVEASLEQARRIEAKAERRRLPVEVRNSPPVFALAPVGRPALAIVWKNLTAVARLRRIRAGMLFLLIAGAVVAALSFEGTFAAEAAGTLAALWGGFVVVLGPQWIRNDLRSDLAKVELLRSYPLRGHEIVAVEVAASTLTLTLLQYALLALAFLAFLGNRTLDLSLAGRTAALGTALLVLPAVNLLSLTLHNGAALLYPGWVEIGPVRRSGVEALGQNLLFTFGFLLLLVLLLAPAALAGVALAAPLQPALGSGALIAGAAAGAVVTLLEAAALVGWLGRVFEQYELGTT